jgi:opacity protein-like surface antigen
MRTLKIALLATVAAAAFSSATMAADLIVDPAPIMYDEPASYGLDGPYAGVYVLGDSNTASFGAGVVLGANFVNDTFLLGIEGDASITTAAQFYGQVVGKAGFATESAAFYGLAGVGFDTLSGLYVPVGVGAEFMVAENVSLKAQGEYHWTGGANDSLVGKFGVNFHF